MTTLSAREHAFISRFVDSVTTRPFLDDLARLSRSGIRIPPATRSEPEPEDLEQQAA